MFREGDDVDILFVSHFHEDHINGIAKLKELTNIKNVIIPHYENDLQKLLLVTLRPRDDEDKLDSLIEQPESFFSSTTRVVRVKTFNGGMNMNSKPIIIDELNNKTIESGTSITTSSLCKLNSFWEYIPYNHKYDERIVVLAKYLEITPRELICGIGDTDLQSKLKNIYRKIIVKESINAHSMMVYSGQYLEAANNVTDLPNGCLYTGDATFNEATTQRLLEHLGNRCSNMIMLQVPHHGSGHSFHDTIFNILKNNSTYPILFLSCGKDNSYGHPSPFVITNCNLFLNSLKCLPILYDKSQREQDVRIVCEDKSSMLVLIFDLNH